MALNRLRGKEPNAYVGKTIGTQIPMLRASKDGYIRYDRIS